MSLLTNIRSLFFPPACPVCGRALEGQEGPVCMRCRYEAPLTGFCRQIDNPLVQRFWGVVPVVNACAFFYYVEESGYRKLVHRFKYAGGWRLAYEAGRWFGAELAAGGLYSGIDAIVPVPVHPLGRLRRGYNQCELLAEGIALHLGVPVEARVLVRRYGPAQARQGHDARWRNVQGKYVVRYPRRLTGRHVLLVDDVFTTGATVTECVRAMVSAVPDCRVSVATLAVSRRIVERGETTLRHG